MSHGIRLGALATVTVSLLVGASSAGAATYTVGSPLTAAFGPGALGTDTITNTALPEAGARVTSPVTGTVVRWRVLDAVGTFNLRVLTPNGGLTYTGSGTSAPRSPLTTGLEAFDTNLPIQAGQAIGLNNLNGNQLGFATPVGASDVFWNPPLADNDSQPGTAGTNEFAFNADVVGRPVVTSLNPSSGPASGGTTVTIAGQELSGATALNFGSRPAATFPVTSDSVITAVSPPGNVGAVDVTVTSLGGHSTPTAADLFTYTGCVVPNLKGAKLKRAKKTLGAADCRLGKVKGRGKVKKERPPAGTVLPVGSKVRLKLG